MKSGKGKVALITLNFPFTIWKTWDNILRFSGKVIENTTIKTASYREVIIRIPLSPPKKGRVAEMKSAARPFMRRPKEYVADRLWKNKRLGKEKGMAKQTLG